MTFEPKPLSRIESRTLVLPAEDVDTDQILPARFLTTTEREGLGRFAFADRRGEPGFPLDDPRAGSAAVLVAGRNFGCGSSREHAAWALADLGVRAVVSTAIADIFRANALQNGIVPVVVDHAAHAWLLARPWATVVVDVAALELELEPGRRVTFPLDRFARRRLLQGVDELGYLLAAAPAIARYEEVHP